MTRGCQNDIASLPPEFATVGKLSFSAKSLQAGGLCQEKK